MPVVVRAQPVNPGGTSPDLGSGVTDSSGFMRVEVDPNSVLNDPAFVHDGRVTLDVLYQDPTGAWQSAGSYTQGLGPRAEPVMANTRVTGSSGAPIAGAALLARLEPVNPATWTGGDYPVAGVGSTDSTGRAVLTPALGPYLNNPTFETGNEVMVLDLYRQATGGSLVFVSRVPYNFGGSKDPVLAQTQVLDAGRNPVANRTVIIRAVPAAPSSWPLGQVYPAVGTGSTDGQGMIDARVDLSRLKGKPKFEDGTGTIQLQAYYYDANAKLQVGATVDEHFTAAGDSLVLVPWCQSEGPDCSSLCNGWAAVTSTNDGYPASNESQYTLPSGSNLPPPGAVVDASGGGGGAQGGAVESVGNNLVTIKWGFTSTQSEPIVPNQTELTWNSDYPPGGCSHGTIPGWEVDKAAGRCWQP